MKTLKIFVAIICIFATGVGFGDTFLAPHFDKLNAIAKMTCVIKIHGKFIADKNTCIVAGYYMEEENAFFPGEIWTENVSYIFQLQMNSNTDKLNKVRIFWNKGEKNTEPVYNLGKAELRFEKENNNISGWDWSENYMLTITGYTKENGYFGIGIAYDGELKSFDHSKDNPNKD